MELGKACLYTSHKLAGPEGTADHPVRWHAKQKYVAAAREFKRAGAAGLVMPVVIADARDPGLLVAWGTLAELVTASGGTRLAVANLQQLQGHSAQELRLLANGKPLAGSARRSHALVQTPDFLHGPASPAGTAAASPLPDGIVEFPFQDSPADQAPIRAWAAAHPHGHVLTFLTPERAMLLGFQCTHVGQLHPKLGPPTPITPRRLCAGSAELLQLWAQAHAVEVRHCRLCEREDSQKAAGRDLEAKGAGSPLNNLREALEDAEVQRLQQRVDIGPEARAALVLARRGHGLYRENVERIETACRVTGVLDRRHLRASHIKPWYRSDDREKLDGHNGLLLAPHIDHLFDRGHISFTDAGELLVSPHTNPVVLAAWGVKAGQKVGAFSPEQRGYLAWHREHVFDHEMGGRRGARGRHSHDNGGGS
jgi:HNH endonuclease